MRFFVTGGSRGIGAAIVLQAALEGHDVAFTYRVDEDSAQKIVTQAATSGQQVRCYQLDVREPEAVEQVGSLVADELGDVDVVVNNAGVVRSNLVAMMTDDEWRDVLDTNLSGAFYVCRYFIPAMLINGFGRVINISSIVSGGMAGMGNYAAAKAGLQGFTKSLAKEYGRKNITANCIVAGAVDTDMAQHELSDRVQRFGKEFAPVSGGRLGTPQEIAKITMFLASEAANYINGADLNVTGGLDWLP